VFLMADGEYLTARFISHGDYVVAALSLTLDARLDEAWTALTAPESLVRWLAPGVIEPRVGGRAKLAFADSGIVIDSVVTAVEPLRVLEYSWSGPGDRLRPVRWTLEAIGARTRLDLTLTLPASEDVARATAGWAAHMEMLASALAGAPQRFPVRMFQAARSAFGEQLAATRSRTPAAAA
jgi:uncharacterized protein YndB with AHSA1/START domain